MKLLKTLMAGLPACDGFCRIGPRLHHQSLHCRFTSVVPCQQPTRYQPSLNSLNGGRPFTAMASFCFLRAHPNLGAFLAPGKRDPPRVAARVRPFIRAPSPARRSSLAPTGPAFHRRRPAGHPTHRHKLHGNDIRPSSARPPSGVIVATAVNDPETPTVTMTDGHQSSTPFTTPALTRGRRANWVGVVPFVFAINNGDWDRGANGSFNVNPQVAKNLWAQRPIAAGAVYG